MAYAGILKLLAMLVRARLTNTVWAKGLPAAHYAGSSSSCVSSALSVYFYHHLIEPPTTFLPAASLRHGGLLPGLAGSASSLLPFM